MFLSVWAVRTPVLYSGVPTSCQNKPKRILVLLTLCCEFSPLQIHHELLVLMRKQAKTVATNCRYKSPWWICETLSSFKTTSQVFTAEHHYICYWSKTFCSTCRNTFDVSWSFVWRSKRRISKKYSKQSSVYWTLRVILVALGFNAVLASATGINISLDVW